MSEGACVIAGSGTEVALVSIPPYPSFVRPLLSKQILVYSAHASTLSRVMADEIEMRTLAVDRTLLVM